MDISQLESKTKEELLDIVKEMDLPDCSSLEKPELVRRLLQADAEQQGNIFSSGILEIMTDGYGFLRQISLLPSQSDIYVSQSQIRRFGLRNGDKVTGQGRPARAAEEYHQPAAYRSRQRPQCRNGEKPPLFHISHCDLS